jgi:hypothetical protein
MQEDQAAALQGERVAHVCSMAGRMVLCAWDGETGRLRSRGRARVGEVRATMSVQAEAVRFPPTSPVNPFVAASRRPTPPAQSLRDEGEVEMNDQQAERLASNQTLFRAVNEKMLALNETFELPSAEFVCECSHLACTETIKITLADYTEVRSNPRWFLVAASDEHVVPEIEDIVSRTDRYFVVEKRDVAGEVAEQAVAH